MLVVLSVFLPSNLTELGLTWRSVILCELAGGVEAQGCMQTSTFLQLAGVAVFSLTQVPVSSIKIQLALCVGLFLNPCSWCAHCDANIMEFLLLWVFWDGLFGLRTIAVTCFACSRPLVFTYESSDAFSESSDAFSVSVKGGSATEPPGFGPGLF